MTKLNKQNKNNLAHCLPDNVLMISIVALTRFPLFSGTEHVYIPSGPTGAPILARRTCWAYTTLYNVSVVSPKFDAVKAEPEGVYQFPIAPIPLSEFLQQAILTLLVSHINVFPGSSWLEGWPPISAIFTESPSLRVLDPILKNNSAN